MSCSRPCPCSSSSSQDSPCCASPASGSTGIDDRLLTEAVRGLAAFGGSAFTRIENDPELCGGDKLWVEAHTELLNLHIEKSATYGNDEDRLANFIAVSRVTGRPPEVYALERIIEKATRALNQLAAGDGQAVKEYGDIAGLSLCAEALRRRG